MDKTILVIPAVCLLIGSIFTIFSFIRMIFIILNTKEHIKEPETAVIFICSVFFNLAIVMTILYLNRCIS